MTLSREKFKMLLSRLLIFCILLCQLTLNHWNEVITTTIIFLKEFFGLTNQQAQNAANLNTNALVQLFSLKSFTLQQEQVRQ